MGLDLRMLLDLQKFFGNPEKEEFFAKWEEFIALWEKLKVIGQYNSLWFAKLLWLFPLSEKDWKVYNKLEKNGKFGFLSKHLLRCSRKVNVPRIYIEEYLNKKKDWEFGKKYYRPSKEKQEEALVKFRTENDLSPALDLIKYEARFHEKRNGIYNSTGNLIEATIELSQREAKLK